MGNFGAFSCLFLIFEQRLLQFPVILSTVINGAFRERALVRQAGSLSWSRASTGWQPVVRFSGLVKSANYAR
jgi:hypothetical protein